MSLRSKPPVPKFSAPEAGSSLRKPGSLLGPTLYLAKEKPADLVAGGP